MEKRYKYMKIEVPLSLTIQTRLAKQVYSFIYLQYTQYSTYANECQYTIGHQRCIRYLVLCIKYKITFLSSYIILYTIYLILYCIILRYGI